MQEDLLKKRISELSDRAFSRSCYTYSAFLTAEEQSEVLSLNLKSAPLLFGGFDDAERKIAVFGNEELCGYSEAPPIAIIEVRPLNKKFSDELTHRDFLGALMNLGIERDRIGDIIINENVGYVFCLDTVKEHILSSLDRVKHTSVTAAEIEALPTVLIKEPEYAEIIAASDRLDAVISAVWRLSRNESKEIIEDGKVALNGKITLSAARSLVKEDKVSARGFGKFIFEGTVGGTKKGRCRMGIRIYK